MTETTFSKLAKLNCTGHVEKKGKFSYLSWPWAVQMLRENAPTATWEVLRFDGLPYLRTDMGYFVEVAVTVDGITLSQIHPVLNGNNRPIESPTVFDINTSIQRCLVKAIALHGLGLYIYAGEDLPPGEAGSEDGGTTYTELDMKALDELREEAMKGTDALREKWKAIGKARRDTLMAELDGLKAAAAEADRQAA